MEHIPLGTQGLVVSKLGYGCMGLTTAYGRKLPDDEIVALLEKTCELGITLWDTATIYIYPDLMRLLSLRSPLVCQEEIIANAIEKVGRENVVIATKTGAALKYFPKISVVGQNDPAFIRSQCEDSLRRLRINTIDVLYLHRIDQNVPIEIAMTTLKELVEEGKIKYVGLSECSTATLRRAHKIHPVSVVQMEWSLWCRGIEDEIVPTCRELGIGIVAYSPLGRGFFGGAANQQYNFTDYRSQQERFLGEAGENNKKMLEAVQQLADRKGCTTAQLALKWLEMQQEKLGGAGVVAIPGTTKEHNLISNVGSLKVELTEEEIILLEAAVPRDQVRGSRYTGDVPVWETDKNRELTGEEREMLGLDE